jgi:integrase/recombinase XerD
MEKLTMKKIQKNKSIKQIKEYITELEYQKLLTYLKGKESLHESTRVNLERTFTLLYYTGCRINEIKQLKLHHIKTILETAEIIIVTPKTNRERKLFFSKNAIKEIKKYFDLSQTDNSFIISTKGDYSKTPSDITFIATVNKFIQEVLGKRYSSHSFRSGLITEMSKSVNPKFIQKFIGHSDINTTMRYIKPTDEDLRACLVR